MKCRLVKNIETNGAMQMAIDEAILTAKTKNYVPNTLRFFTWNPPCLTIGYFQSLQKEVNLEKAKDMDIVRRYSGGGATLHDKELTYSLAISEKQVPNDIVESYRVICDAIVKGLQLLNINAEFKEINDILVKGKKISGNAQTRKEGVVLQHGTVLLDAEIDKMFSLLKVSDEKTKEKMIKTAKERVTTLKQELGQADIKKLQEALIKGFKETFNVELQEEELTDYESGLAKELYKKYSSNGWNYSR